MNIDLYSNDYTANLQSKILTESLNGKCYTFNNSCSYKPKKELSFLPFLKLKRFDTLITINSNKLDFEKKKRLIQLNSEIQKLKYFYQEKNPLQKIDLKIKTNEKIGMSTLPIHSKINERNNSWISNHSVQMGRSFTNKITLREKLLTDDYQRQSWMNLRVKSFIKNLDEAKENEKKLENEKMDSEKYKNISTIKSFIKNYYSKSSFFNFTVKEKWKFVFHRVLENIYKIRALRAKTKTEKNMWKRRSTINHEAVQDLVLLKNKIAMKSQKIDHSHKIDYTPKNLAKRLQHKSNKTVIYKYINTKLTHKTVYEIPKFTKIEEENE